MLVVEWAGVLVFVLFQGRVLGFYKDCEKEAAFFWADDIIKALIHLLPFF